MTTVFLMKAISKYPNAAMKTQIYIRNPKCSKFVESRSAGFQEQVMIRKLKFYWLAEKNAASSAYSAAP